MTQRGAHDIAGARFLFGFLEKLLMGATFGRFGAYTR